MNPTMEFADRELKKEPCPQSWKMMKTRTRNAPARTASGSVIHQATCTVKYIRTQRSEYGTMVLTICQRARPIEGCWNLATISFQAAMSAPRWTVVELADSLIVSGLRYPVVEAYLAWAGLQARIFRLIGSRTSAPSLRRMLRTLRRMSSTRSVVRLSWMSFPT